MIRHALPRLLDMDQNIRLVLDLIKGRSFNHFKHDVAFRYAVNYAILIIAEAANGLPDGLRARHPSIPWRKLIAIGHKLRHEYFRIDDDIMWEVATKHLAPLLAIVARMKDEPDEVLRS